MKHLAVIMGMPGAGKDTQAALLEKSEHLTVIRVGDEVRKLAAHDKHLAEELQSGQLADKSVVDGVVLSALDHSLTNAHLLSDGYPRSLDQARALSRMCQKLKIDLVQVLYLELPEDEVYTRLKLRNRADDTPETIKNRLEVFFKETEPVLDYYREHNLLDEVNGLGTVEEVADRIRKVIKVV